MTGTCGTRKTGTLRDAIQNATQETESTLAEDVFAAGTSVNPQIQTPEFGPVNFTIVEEEADVDDGHAWLNAVLSSPNRDELAAQASPALDVPKPIQPSQVPSLTLILATVALVLALGFLLF